MYVLIDGLWYEMSCCILSDANKNVMDTMMRVMKPPMCVFTSDSPRMFHCGVYFPKISTFFRSFISPLI